MSIYKRFLRQAPPSREVRGEPRGEPSRESRERSSLTRAWKMSWQKGTNARV